MSQLVLEGDAFRFDAKQRTIKLLPSANAPDQDARCGQAWQNVLLHPVILPLFVEKLNTLLNALLELRAVANSDSFIIVVRRPPQRTTHGSAATIRITQQELVAALEPWGIGPNVDMAHYLSSNGARVLTFVFENCVEARVTCSLTSTEAVWYKRA